MKRFIYILLFFVSFVFITTSCNSWLDIQQDSEEKAENMFDSYTGFQGALSGCYSDLAGSDLYGTRLTMSDIEALAGFWYIDPSWSLSTTLSECYNLSNRDYTNSYSSSAIKSIYAGLYHAILESNYVLKGCQEKGDNITYPKSKSIIEGETYALRALCQLDVLRLFGQLPQNATIKVQLPYSETTSIDEIPSYYNYNEYIEKIDNDLNKAVSLLKDNDPICNYSYKELSSTNSSTGKTNELEDDFMADRRYRLNYWAVKALQARYYLYIGETQKAHDLAMEVINAKTSSGESMISLSSNDDYGQGGFDYASSSECLFCLWVKDLYDETVSLLGGYETSKINVGNYLILSQGWYNELFNGANMATDIRYRNLWSQTRDVNGASIYPSIKKYCVDRSSNTSKTEGIIPMIRLSEMYLIAVETSMNLSEANNLYTTYMLSKGVLLTNPFVSLGDIKKELEKEYRREFFAEGQMFYFYKRNQISSMWSKEDKKVTETGYILPLPNTEYNSNK